MMKEDIEASHNIMAMLSFFSHKSLAKLSFFTCWNLVSSFHAMTLESASEGQRANISHTLEKHRVRHVMNQNFAVWRSVWCKENEIVGSGTRRTMKQILDNFRLLAVNK